MNINWTDVKTFFINQNEVTKIQLNGTTLWQKSSGPTPGPLDPTEPFYIENLDSGSNTISFKKSSNSAPTLTIEYSTDKTTWTTLGSTSRGGLTISVPANSKMYFRCSATAWVYSYYNNFISATSSFNAGGNIMSLLYGSNFTGNETTFPSGSSTNFESLFQNSVNLIDASRLILPATTLAQYCYSNMFSGCTGLTTAPELPATTLAPYCYNRMFEKCSSLTQAPALPATTLAEYCYQQMFYNCTSITTAPELPATTLAQYCYSNMFLSCSSLTTAPELPATTLATRCYNNMLKKCTSLITAPELPATTLAQYCYSSMFEECSSLNYIKCLATDISATGCTLYWVNGIVNSGTFVKDASMSSWTTGASGIPTGWTVQDAS